MNREVKSQPIRVFDVVAFSPFLVWLGLRRDRRLSDTERFLLVAMGIGTAVYNARNYLRIEAREAQRGLGSPEFVHAAKLPPWLLRLESATALLNQAIQQRNRAAIAAAAGDVWFWLGRVLCDAFSVDATHTTPLSRKAAKVIPQAYQAAARARQLLGAP